MATRPVVSLDEALTRKVVLAEVEHVPLPSLHARRMLRELIGLSQKDLSLALGLPRVSVTLWECGRAEPEGENRVRYRDGLLKIARKFSNSILDEFSVEKNNEKKQ